MRTNYIIWSDIFLPNLISNNLSAGPGRKHLSTKAGPSGKRCQSSNLITVELHVASRSVIFNIPYPNHRFWKYRTKCTWKFSAVVVPALIKIPLNPAFSTLQCSAFLINSVEFYNLNTTWRVKQKGLPIPVPAIDTMSQSRFRIPSTLSCRDMVKDLLRAVTDLGERWLWRQSDRR